MSNLIPIWMNKWMNEGESEFPYELMEVFISINYQQEKKTPM